MHGRLVFLGAFTIALGAGFAEVGCSSDSSSPDMSAGTGASAGSDATGGTSSTGGTAGTTSAGGASAGGTGGASTGGATTGGSGGAATGGASAGGSGGASTGGASTGGSGGASTGGASTMQATTVTNLVSDTDAAPDTDANLVNPWGLAFNPSGPLWVANNHSSTATVYDVSKDSTLGLVVSIPAPGGGMGAPSGQIYNGTSGFSGDLFLFSTEDGTVIGWGMSSGMTSTIRYDNSAAGAIYKGLAALPVSGSKNVLLLADFHNAKVDVLDDTYTPTTLAGSFSDPSVPSGYAPFNVLVDSGNVYVAFAKQDDMAMDDAPGTGFGYVSVFDATGALTKSLVAGGDLNAPWGLAMAPSDFGSVGGKLLVGNFGDGAIHAYDPTTGALAATLTDAMGMPLAIDGLWAITFGNDTAGAAHNQLFFSAGPSDESHGLLGRIDAN